MENEELLLVYNKLKSEGRLRNSASFDDYVAKMKSNPQMVADINKYAYKSGITKDANANRWFSKSLEAQKSKQEAVNKQKEIESLAKTKVNESNQIQQEKRNQQILEEQAKVFKPTETITQFPKMGVVAEYEKATGVPIKQVEKKETEIVDEKKSFSKHLSKDIITSGINEFNQAWSGIPESLYTLFAIPQNFVAAVTGLDIEANSTKFKDAYNIKNPILNAYIKEGENINKRIEGFNEENYESSSIYENIKKGNYTDALELTVSGVVRSAPISVSMMVGGATMSASKLATMGTVAFINKNQEQLDKENPDMSEIEKNIKAVGLSGAEFVFEALGTGSIGRVYKDIILKEGTGKGSKIFKEGLINAYKKSLKGYGAVSGTLGEMIEEGATQVTQNMINGKPYMEGVFDAMAIGGASGAAMTAPINIINTKNKINNLIKSKQASKIMDAKTKTKVNKIDDAIDKLDNDLQQEMPESIKEKLQAVKQKLVDEKGNAIESEYEKFKNLPIELKDKLGDLEDKLDVLKSEYYEIEGNPNISRESKDLLKEEIAYKAQSLLDSKKEIINYKPQEVIEGKEDTPSPTKEWNIEKPQAQAVEEISKSDPIISEKVEKPITDESKVVETPIEQPKSEKNQIPSITNETAPTENSLPNAEVRPTTLESEQQGKDKSVQPTVNSGEVKGDVEVEYKFTNTPSLKNAKAVNDNDLPIPPKAVENILKNEDSWDKALVGEVKNLGNGWFEVGKTEKGESILHSPKTNKTVTIIDVENKGGRNSIYVADFVENNAETPEPKSKGDASVGKKNFEMTREEYTSVLKRMYELLSNAKIMRSRFKNVEEARDNNWDEESIDKWIEYGNIDKNGFGLTYDSMVLNEISQGNVPSEEAFKDNPKLIEKTKLTIENGSFEERIKQGKITKENTIKIIKNAGLTVPKSIRNLPETPQPKSKGDVDIKVKNAERISKKELEKGITDADALIVNDGVKSDLEKAQETRRLLKAKLDAKRGISSFAQDSKQDAQDLYDYHQALVTEAKEYIKLGIKTLNDFAKKLGEKVSVSVKLAWDEANGDIKPILNADELNYDFDNFNDEVDEKADKKEAFERKEGEKSLFKRVYEGETDDVLKNIVETHGLNYKIENQIEVQKLAKEFVKKAGINKALEALKNNLIKGAEKAFVYAEVLDVLTNTSETASLDELLKIQEDYSSITDDAMVAFDEEARSAGRFISALYKIYQTSKIKYNLTKQINDYKANNNGEISEEVLTKFKEADKKIQELEIKIKEILEKQKKEEGDDAIESINESIEREKTKKIKQITNTDKAKLIANNIRKAKIHKPSMFASATPASIVWDGAVETVAKSIELGVSITDAIRNGVDFIKNSDWFKSLNKQDKSNALNEFQSNIINISGQQLVVVSDDGKIKVPEQLIRDLVESGINNIDILSKEVLNILKESYPDYDITIREVRDAITKYGKTVNPPSEDHISIEIAKLKRTGKLISALEDVISGKRPKKSGFLRAKPTQTERELRSKVNYLLKEFPINEADLEKARETALEKYKTRLENQIEDIKNQIAGKNIEYKEKPTQITNNEIERLKKIKESNLKELNKLRKEAGIVEKRRLKQAKTLLENQIKLYQKKLKDKDFSKRKLKPLESDGELKNLNKEKVHWQEVFEKERYKLELENKTRKEKFKDIIIGLLNIPRILTAGAEWSMMLIQGGIQTASLATRNPKALARTFAKAIIATGSQRKMNEYTEILKSHEKYPLMKQTKLALTESDYKMELREEEHIGNNLVYGLWNLIGDGIEYGSIKVFGIKNVGSIGSTLVSIIKKDIKSNKIPISERWKNMNPLLAFERGNTIYMNELRRLRFEDGVKMLQMEGKNEIDHIEDYKKLSSAVNTMTGRANLGRLEQVNDIISVIFFSFKNTVSVFNQLNPYFYASLHSPNDPITKASTGQKLIVRDMLNFVTITTSMMYLLQAAAGSDEDDEPLIQIDTDPRSSDFMQMKLKGKEKYIRFDPWHGMRPQVVFFAKFISGLQKNKEGKIKRIGKGFKADTQWDNFMRTYIENKLSPSASIVYKYMDSEIKTIKGEEIRVRFNEPISESFDENFYPMYINALIEIEKEDPSLIIRFLSVSSMFGVNTGVYGDINKKDK